MISLCDRFILRNLAKSTGKTPYTLHPFIITDILQKYLDLLILYLCNGMNCSHLHEEKFKELFIIFRSYYSRREWAELFHPLISRDIDFKSSVLEHYSKARTAKELAQLMGYTVTDFRNKFFDCFGEPVYKWMQEQKKNKLLFRMKTGNASLSILAEEYGFSSVSHLNKFCKSQFGKSPTELKKALKQEDDPNPIPDEPFPESGKGSSG